MKLQRAALGAVAGSESGAGPLNDSSTCVEEMVVVEVVASGQRMEVAEEPAWG